MRGDVHARARSLMDQALVEGISDEEQRWLVSHNEACSACSAYAETGLRTVRALDGFAFTLDAGAAVRVQEAVLRRAAERPERHFDVGVAIAVALTIVGSLLAWETAAWLASGWGVAPHIWQGSLLLFWVLPSVMIDLLLILRRQGRLI